MAESQSLLTTLFNRMVQFPGEFIVIYPKTMYMTFDLGFNISESAYYYRSEKIFRFNQRTSS